MNAGLWAEERERMKAVHAFRHPPRFKFAIKKV